jgi:hypothetical protein
MTKFIGRELRGQKDGRDHALRVGDTPARDVERRPMIDRRPDNRETERDVDCAPERDQLDRDQSLIVIARDDDVELSAPGANKNSVGGERTGDVDAPGAAAGDRRLDDLLLLQAEQSVFSGMGIESGNAQPRP